jgi:hypothetical protein
MDFLGRESLGALPVASVVARVLGPAYELEGLQSLSAAGLSTVSKRVSDKDLAGRA